MILFGHIQVLSNKNKYCYANNGYFEKIMKISGSTVKRCLKELEDIGIITRENIYKKDSKEIEMRKIFVNLGMVKNDLRSSVKNDLTSSVKNDPDNTTRNNNKITNILDVPSDDDYYGKIFFKIVDNYPANRIGNRQHGLKKFKLLTKEDAKLAILNLKRYLDCVSEPRYVKTLQNYIIEECWSEAWLLAEETKNKPKDTKYKSDGKTINTQHIDKF
jgi:DNA-binding Lrp family transcriptional regulator